MLHGVIIDVILVTAAETLYHAPETACPNRQQLPGQVTQYKHPYPVAQGSPSSQQASPFGPSPIPIPGDTVHDAVLYLCHSVGASEYW